MFGTVASRFNDDGVTALYQHLRGLLAGEGSSWPRARWRRSPTKVVDRRWPCSSRPAAPATWPRSPRPCAATTPTTAEQVDAVRAVEQLEAVRRPLDAAGRPRPTSTSCSTPPAATSTPATVDAARALRRRTPPRRRRDRPAESLSGTLVPRIALPRVRPSGASWCASSASENLPGHFPFTAGVFPTKRDDEDPTRMFAGEGGPAKTNARFHLLAAGQPATRLSTAFDSVTLYGADPDERPDIYGKVGNSGVSIATLDDMKVLYDGFDLFDPSTSVSMTINGPAPAILAMFLNTAIDQHPELDPAEVLRQVRGTVQADILKEDQGQNTCIFSTEFALRMMADIQEWFVEHEVRRFYSVSISGYHIAEAGANPISQLAFTLVQRLHLRRGLPRPGHGDRRLRPQPQLLLLQRHGPRVHGARPGGPAHLGRRHARPLRRQRRAARS